MQNMIEKKKPIKEDIKQVSKPSYKKINRLVKIGSIQYFNPQTKDITEYNIFTTGSVLYYYAQDTSTILDQDVSPTEYGDLWDELLGINEPQ